MAYTYNDPVVFHEYAVDVALACREEGVRSVAVSAGYVLPEPRREFYAVMDAVNVDLKAFTERFYREMCAGHLEPVLDTLRWLVRETRVWTEVTTLLIPGANDSDGELHALTAWVGEELGPHVPLHFSAFHPDWKLRHVPPTPTATLERARGIARANGLRYVYTGNVRDPDGQSTWCHACGARLVGRDGYELTGWALTPQGRCRPCGEACAGVFEARPGSWGARRMPVRLSRV